MGTKVRDGQLPLGWASSTRQDERGSEMSPLLKATRCNYYNKNEEDAISGN